MAATPASAGDPDAGGADSARADRDEGQCSRYGSVDAVACSSCQMPGGAGCNVESAHSPATRGAVSTVDGEGASIGRPGQRRTSKHERVGLHLPRPRMVVRRDPDAGDVVNIRGAAIDRITGNVDDVGQPASAWRPDDASGTERVATRRWREPNDPTEVSAITIEGPDSGSCRCTTAKSRHPASVRGRSKRIEGQVWPMQEYASSTSPNGKDLACRTSSAPRGDGDEN
jgi:hypothetical protein